MPDCLNCPADNLNDGPLCPTCASKVHFIKPEIVEINDLNDVPTPAVVERQSIARATRIIGNYAWFPELGWRRYVTLASATWNQYMY